MSDQQITCIRRFEERLRTELKPLITDSLIEEHRRTFGRRRSDALERVLSYFRRAAVQDKYAVLAVRPFKEYRIIALSGKRGLPPRIVDENIFRAPQDAFHAVFLKRVQDLLNT